MDRKKIVIISAVAIIVIAVAAYLLKAGIVSINISKTPFRDPGTGKVISRKEFANKTANDLYKDATEFNRKGNYEDAKNFLDESIKRDKNDTNIPVMRELALAEYNLKKYDSAIEVYKKIIELDPASGRSYNEIGNVYRDMGDKKMAEESYRKAIGVDGEYVLAYNNLAMMFIQDNNVEGAKQVLQDGLEKNKDNPELQEILKSL